MASVVRIDFPSSAHDTVYNGSANADTTVKEYAYFLKGLPMTKAKPQVNDNFTEYRTDVFTTLSSQSNVSESLEAQPDYQTAEHIWQICPVILFIFGTFGNVAILITLRHLRLGRTCMHIYLRALALSDLCVLYTGLLRWWVTWMLKFDLRNEHVILCKVHTWLVYVSVAVSAWLLVVMTCERAWSTCLPHRVNAFCTTRKARFLIGFIMLFHGIIHSHFLFGLSLKKDNETGEYLCKETSPGYIFFLHRVWPLVDICLMSILPFCFVIFGNVIIVWKTLLSLKAASDLNLSSGTNAQMRRREASSMTVILLSLSALFLLTTSPVCVFNIWERGSSWNKLNETVSGNARIELIWAAVSIVMYCNNTFNFYLYCLTGRKFRREIKRQLTPNRSDSQSNFHSGQSFQRFFILKDLNRINTYVDKRGSTFRASSVRFQTD